jgi:hypothetical protein
VWRGGRFKDVIAAEERGEVRGAGEGERPSQASCYRNGFKGERKLSIQPGRCLKPKPIVY